MSAARQRIGNGRRVAWSRSTLLVLPAACAFVALAGVTARPMASLVDARLERERAQELGERAERAQRIATRNREGDRLARARAQDARLAGLFPGELTPIQVYSLARLAARDAGFAVDALQLGDTRGLGPELDGQVVVARELSVNGTGTPNALLDLVSNLRLAGLPTSVADLSLSRGDPGTARFRISARLRVHHYGAASRFAPADQGAPATEETPAP